MRVKGRMCTCTEVRGICVVREKENMNILRVLKVYITRYASVWERTCALKYILIRCEKRREKKYEPLRTYWSVEKCEREREREFTRARLCARERETRRVSISRKHWTNIDVSSLHFLSRDEKRVVLFIYQLLSSISEWKRGRARNCVNPCPFFSFPSLLFFFFFIFSPFHNRMFTTVCCIRLQLETSTSLFENKIPRIIGIRAVGIVLIGLNSKLMDNGNGWTLQICTFIKFLNYAGRSVDGDRVLLWKGWIKYLNNDSSI